MARKPVYFLILEDKIEKYFEANSIANSFDLLVPFEL